MQIRVGDVMQRYAEIKHRAGQMFRRMDLALDAQDFLGPWDSNVVDGVESKMAETCPQAGVGGERPLGAPRTSMEVQHQLRTPARDIRFRPRKGAVHAWVALQD